LKNYARMMERMKDTNRKEDFLPRKYEGVLLCWAALSLQFLWKCSFFGSVVSFLCEARFKCFLRVESDK